MNQTMLEKVAAKNTNCLWCDGPVQTVRPLVDFCAYPALQGNASAYVGLCHDCKHKLGGVHATHFAVYARKRKFINTQHLFQCFQELSAATGNHFFSALAQITVRDKDKEHVSLRSANNQKEKIIARDCSVQCIWCRTFGDADNQVKVRRLLPKSVMPLRSKPFHNYVLACACCNAQRHLFDVEEFCRVKSGADIQTILRCLHVLANTPETASLACKELRSMQRLMPLVLTDEEYASEELFAKDIVETFHVGRGRLSRMKTIIERDGRPKCVWCRQSLGEENPITFEHLLAKSTGGPDTVDNIVLACGPCNNTRGSEPLASFSCSKPKADIALIRSRLSALVNQANVPSATLAATALQELATISSYAT